MYIISKFRKKKTIKNPTRVNLLPVVFSSWNVSKGAAKEWGEAKELLAAMEAGEGPPPSRVTYAELRAAAEAAGEFSLAAELRDRKSTAPLATPSRAKATAMAAEATRSQDERTTTTTATTMAVNWVCEECGWRNRPTNLICGGARSENRPVYGCGAPKPSAAPVLLTSPEAMTSEPSSSRLQVSGAQSNIASKAPVTSNNNQPFDSIPIMSNMNAFAVGESKRGGERKESRSTVLKKEELNVEDDDEGDDYLKDLMLFDEDDADVDEYLVEQNDEEGGSGGGSDAWTVAEGQPVEVWGRDSCSATCSRCRRGSFRALFILILIVIGRVASSV